uniref:Uncharacterized protein n=1 Tax=Anopheles culicifacies TaxID=139723 RepID=A0A182MUB1_9DIPT
MASRKTSTVSDSVTILTGVSMQHRTVTVSDRGTATGNCSNEHNQNGHNDHRRQEPHFPQIKIVIDEPELPAAANPRIKDAALALHTLRRHSTRRRSSSPSPSAAGGKGLNLTPSKPTSSAAFLTIYNHRAGGGGGSYGSYYPDSREDLRLYAADYVDEDDEYGFDTDGGGYRLHRIGRGMQGDYDEDEEEEEDAEEGDEQDEDDDEDNGRDYHRFGPLRIFPYCPVLVAPLLSQSGCIWF